MYKDDQNWPMPDTREPSVSENQTVTEGLPTQNLAKPWQAGC